MWGLLGDVEHYVEPFAGSCAVLLERPHEANRSYYSETVNDLDGFLVNVWRSLRFSPDATAEACSWPVTEADKTARQIRLLRWRDEVDLERLFGDPEWHDPVMAGWWLYAVACQIGAFAGDGPWTCDPTTGRIHKQGRTTFAREAGVKRDLPHLANDGQGVNHAGTREAGVTRNRPHLGNNGQGVNHAGAREAGVSRDRPHLGDDGQGVNHAGARESGVVGEDLNDVDWDDDLYGFHPWTMPEIRRWFAYLSARLRHVRVVNGDWRRVLTKGASWTIPVRMNGGHCGVFLDPPYAIGERSRGLYAHDDKGGTMSIPDAVREWCAANGHHEEYRIVLAGYDTEHAALEDAGWTVHEWFTEGYLTGGMGNTDKSGDGHQQHRERLWASPHCLGLDGPALAQPSLFDMENT